MGRAFLAALVRHLSEGKGKRLKERPLKSLRKDIRKDFKGISQGFSKGLQRYVREDLRRLDCNPARLLSGIRECIAGDFAGRVHTDAGARLL